MHVKSFVWAALLVAMAAGANVAQAQYGPVNPYGGYPVMPAGLGSVMPVGGISACDAPAPSCSAGCGCTTPCPSNCGCDDSCCQGYWNRFQVFADFLYLRPRGAEVAYAVPANGVVTGGGGIIVNPATPIAQVGPVQTINPDFQPGFRVGGGFTLDECSMVQATYTQLDSNSTNSIQIPGGAGPVLFPLVEPFLQNATSTHLDAQADQSIQFKLIDVDYKGLFAYCCDYRAAFIVGARYAQLDQDFNYLATVNGFSQVHSHSSFNGAGLRLGLEGERYGRRNFFGYGRGVVNLLGGEATTRYQWGNQGQSPIVDTSWRAGRLVTITDIEVGLGWQNCCGNIRIKAGYMVSMWTNVVKNQEWINAVQKNNFVDPSDNFNGFMTFDGLTTGIEYLW